MFLEKGFPPDWSTHRRLIWESMLSGGSLPWQTFTGNPVQFDAPKAHTLKSVKVEFSPKQDLHGYDAPWPPGGGKQKFNKDTATDGEYINASGNPVTASTYGHSEIIAVEPNTTYYMSGYGGSGIYAILALDGDKNTIPTWYGGASKTAAFTATTPADCRYVILNYYVEQKDTVLFKASDGDTSFAPYSNECPISGWTGCEVTRTGKNLFDPNVFLTATGWSEADGVYSGNCQNIQFSTIGYLLELPNLTEQVTVSFNGYVDYENSRAGYFRIYYADGTTSLLEFKEKTWKNYSLTSTSGETIVGIGFTMSNPRNVSIKDFQVELGSTASAYSPYTGETTTLSFGQTVYGGTAEVAGDGTATGSDEWENIASYNGETITEPWLSSMDKYVSGTTPTTGAQVVYKKSNATPVTPTVTGQPTAVQGINTMWSDANGDVTVEARAEAVNLNA